LLILAGGVTAALAWYSAANLSRAAERQAAALASAHRAGQVRDEFLASASHELRTPLSHIKGFASSLRQTDVQWDEETRREFLTEIEDETDRLAKMIGDLLDMSRIESGGMDSPVRVPVMVTALVDGGVDRVRALLRGREIDVDLPADLPPVLADAGLIERVIGNLVENAAKYAPPDRPIRVAAVAEDDAIEVRVEDEGPGIPPEYLEQVFDKFFRVKGAGRSPIPGTGLGLAICRAIIQTHGGRIWAENRSSGGARFIVRLPRAPSAATAS
jgi:two-component system sensor histidine kinase KdpD